MIKHNWIKVEKIEGEDDALSYADVGWRLFILLM